MLLTTVFAVNEVTIPHGPTPISPLATMTFEMTSDPKELRNFLIALGLGGLTGAAIIQSHHDEEAKSQAEREDPDGCEWLCNVIWDLLDDWEPEGFDSQDD
jgi:hypothetical protein